MTARTRRQPRYGAPRTLLAVLVLLVVCGGCVSDDVAVPTPTPALPTSTPTPTPTPIRFAPTSDEGVPDLVEAACRDVIVLGARGSGQPSGLGAEVSAVVGALTARLGQDRVAAEAVAYRTSPIQDVTFDTEGFRIGVRRGGRALLTQHRRLAERCPDARVVWAGFSQGALVVRSAMDTTTPTQSGVVSVVLLADPDRSAAEQVSRGDAPVTDEQVADVQGEGRAVSGEWVPHTTSWCVAGDPICDRTVGDLLSGLSIHARGYRGLGAVVAAEVSSLLS